MNNTKTAVVQAVSIIGCFFFFCFVFSETKRIYFEFLVMELFTWWSIVANQNTEIELIIEKVNIF